MFPRNREDRITLRGVKLRPRLGVTQGERRQPQLCEADITIWGDFEAAASTDSLERAIDYSKILSTALATAQSREYYLLEALAHQIAKAVLQAFPARRVAVRVRKRPASLKEKLDHVEVEVEQS